MRHAPTLACLLILLTKDCAALASCLARVVILLTFQFAILAWLDIFCTPRLATLPVLLTLIKKRQLFVSFAPVLVPNALGLLLLALVATIQVIYLTVHATTLALLIILFLGAVVFLAGLSVLPVLLLLLTNALHALLLLFITIRSLIIVRPTAHLPTMLLQLLLWSVYLASFPAKHALIITINATIATLAIFISTSNANPPVPAITTKTEWVISV